MKITSKAIIIQLLLHSSSAKQLQQKSITLVDQGDSELTFVPQPHNYKINLSMAEIGLLDSYADVEDNESSAAQVKMVKKKDYSPEEDGESRGGPAPAETPRIFGEVKSTSFTSAFSSES